jgi:transcriptional regulator with PAS, ATPase and Fis domain
MEVNCAAITDTLFESELFGHEKGSFTDAKATKKGLMELADRGTLFLDEVSEMSLGSQAKLLRSLQERQVRRVGGTALIDVDVRIVSATNRDLRASAAKGEFRDDLFYRINVIAIALPPLREREGDVELLSHAFLERYGKGRLRGIDDDALATLKAYRWPGNVRELQNVIERACALADGDRVRVADLPDYVAGGGGTVAAAAGGAGDTVEAERATGQGLSLKDAKEQWMGVLEASYLRELLARHDGNVSAAAKAAGIDRKTFHRLINKYELK